MASAAAVRPAPSLALQILEGIKTITPGLATGQLLKNISRLNEQIFQYLKPEDAQAPRCRFFAMELRLYGHLMQTAPLNRLVDLSQKVDKAVRYLEQARAKICLKPFKAPKKADANLGEALGANNRTALHKFSQHIEQIESNQLVALFMWALDNWDPTILNRILKKCGLGEQSSDLLIDKAFAQKDLASVAYPLMLFHFDALSDTAKERIAQSIGHQETAHALCHLARVLKETCDIPMPELDLPPSWPESKEHLRPLIEEVIRLLTPPVPPFLQTALHLWEHFVASGELPALEAIHMTHDILQKRLENVLASAATAMPHYLLIPPFIQSLPEKVMARILTWADENDDDRLVCFLIEHDFLESKTLNAIVSGHLESQTFGAIAERVYPAKLHLLDRQNRQQVVAWGEKKKTPTRPDPREKKVDPSLHFNTLRETIRAGQPQPLKVLLKSPNTRYLSEKEFEELLEEALKAPLCLGELLSSPHLKISPEFFMKKLRNVLEKQNWHAAGLLIESVLLQQVGVKRFQEIAPLFQNAPQDLSERFQQYVEAYTEWED